MKRLILSALAVLFGLNASLSNAYDRVTYIHSNGQGTPVAASDEQGNLEWRAEYLPFGGEFSHTEIRRENDIGYSNKQFDEEIGLVYFGARHYDPQVGRFTSIDPAQATAQNYMSFNRYAYANNNPYKYVDPNGEFPFLIPVAIFIGKEIAAELASRATGGATDFLSLRRLGTKAVKQVVKSTRKVEDGWTNATKDTRVFHRRNDPIENIEKIKESGELRGNPPTNVFASDIPKVQAFDGPLPPGQKGFEFTTPSIPDKGSVPGRPDFSGNGFNPTVETRNGQAVIKCTVTKVSC